MKKLLVMGLLLIVSIPNKVKADNSSEVTLAFNLTVEDRFMYEVKVSNGGSLYDGSQKITNGIMEYQLSVGEEKVFQIRPDIGYEVNYIKVNGEESNKEQGVIKVQGVSATSTLEVKYKKVNEAIDKPDMPNSNLPVQPEKPTDKVETSDSLVVEMYLLLGSIAVIVMYASRKRHINIMKDVINMAISKDIVTIGERKTLKEKKENEK